MSRQASAEGPAGDLGGSIMTRRFPNAAFPVALGRPLLAAFIIAAVPAVAQAQSSWQAEWDRIVSSADATWKTEWDRLVAGARKEGEVVMVVPPSRTHRDFLAREWPKAYPEIKISMTTIAGPQLLPRFKVEREGGKYLWDLVLTGTENGFQLRDAGFADPVLPEFVLPDVKDPKTWGGWETAFFDNERKYVFATRSFLKMPYYNAKLLSPGKVEQQGVKVLIDPELKGKVIWHEPTAGGSGRTFGPVMMRMLGDDGFRKLVQEQTVFVSAMNDVVERMARGQFAVGLGPVMTQLLGRYKKAGVDFDIRPLGNTPKFGAYGNTGGSNAIVVKDRPHSNATRVFLNWYMSKPVATALSAAMGEDSRRTDVPAVAPVDERRVPGVDYWEAQREEYDADFERARRLILEFRGKS
jgi:ABC-type Fe3+ transport system substrate-binding protein